MVRKSSKQKQDESADLILQSYTNTHVNRKKALPHEVEQNKDLTTLVRKGKVEFEGKTIQRPKQFVFNFKVAVVAEDKMKAKNVLLEYFPTFYIPPTVKSCQGYTHLPKHFVSSREFELEKVKRPNLFEINKFLIHQKYDQGKSKSDGEMIITRTRI
jgi:hypothetical protein